MLSCVAGGDGGGGDDGGGGVAVVVVVPRHGPVPFCTIVVVLRSLAS